ncbi:dUTP diphosphatase [Bacillus toyonensis]|uniref:dUTP diphosphatase n=1 Tax=Bacillus toyonensis TaxID=155322 RepID=UPI002175E641|nr:dUTP diphosphatase [Bacillus toyonensis]
MELTKLFEVQAGLKKHIGYKGKDKFPKMMLALQVELMECANDWRGFKYWSKDQNRKPSLLEEYVDALHLVLETGIDLHESGYLYKLPNAANPYRRSYQIHEQYQQVLYVSLMLQRYMNEGHKGLVAREYMCLLEDFLELGRILGFTPEQIHDAYMEKNEVNHQRQENGY